jgi:EAL and modified HD-GYP domain-containing signal transduction protein
MLRYVARQPILDRCERLYGYEILFRPGEEEIWPSANGNGAGKNNSGGIPAFEGLDEITGGARAFIKYTPQALTGGYAAKLPRERVVLEIPASRESDDKLVTACRELKEAGFVLALENFQGAWQEPLAEVADIIKVDVTASTDRAQWLLLRKYRPRGATFVAERVDRRTQFQAAVQQGFSYFQGPFYCRPHPSGTSEVAPTKLVYLLVLRAITRPEINVQEVTDIIKHDLALSYRLLRFLNSPRFAFRSQIKSIRHALLLLGQDEIRKWIGLISVSSLGEGTPPLLVNMALLRATFCESLAPLVGAAKRQSDYFFLGLLSCIDVIVGRPMRLVLAELPIAADVSGALTGEENPLGTALQAVISYEQGNWGEFSQSARKLGLNEDGFAELYMQALHWSGELTAGEKNHPDGRPPS